ncbi:MAG: ribosomal L7Ae/L30e/S12e/Gadd45 family protein [Firmicutes bacterium]|nr:ribosomal L7Ae/L30e/S12e/Gadd45 family protein [Bacillota bacterium]
MSKKQEIILTPEQQIAVSKKKMLSYMGFAAKARKIVNGYNTCIFTMEKGRVRLLIIAEDLAENSKKKMTQAAERLGVKYRIYGDADEMSHMTGTEGKGIFGITDENFADVISKEIDNIQLLDREVF